MAGSETSKPQCTQSILVNIKYQSSSRCLSVPQGSILADIRDDFMELFADIIPQDSNPSDFKFYSVKGGPGSCERILLQDNHRLKNNELLLAEDLDPGPVIYHPIVSDVPYYKWSMCSQVNDGLMKRDAGFNVIKCNGNSSDPKDLIQFTANDVTPPEGPRYVFTLPVSGDANKVYAIKGQGENMDVITEEIDKSAISPSMDPEYMFECVQFFSYMQYRCDNVGGRDDLYISALQDGTVSLQKAGVQGYPRPSTLFIAANLI